MDLDIFAAGRAMYAESAAKLVDKLAKQIVDCDWMQASLTSWSLARDLGRLIQFGDTKIPFTNKDFGRLALMAGEAYNKAFLETGLGDMIAALGKDKTAAVMIAHSLDVMHVVHVGIAMAGGVDMSEYTRLEKACWEKAKLSWPAVLADGLASMYLSGLAEVAADFPPEIKAMAPSWLKNLSFKDGAN